MKITRRSLMTLAGLGVLGLTVPACRRILGQILFSPDAAPATPPPAFANPFTRGGQSLVAIVRGRDAGNTVRRALQQLGGLERLGLAGHSVLVKPNVVSGEPPPATTDPLVVTAVLEAARESGARSLAVGDMSAVLRLPSRPNLERTGIARAAQAAGATVVAFDEGDWVEVHPPGAELARTVYVARAAHEAGRLISVPVIKAHRSATFSCALKNTVGCVHGKNKPWAYGTEGWEPSIAELHLAVRPHLHVVDGLRSMVSGGPWSGEVDPTDLILASGDPVALDAVVLSLLKTIDRSPPIRAQAVWDSAQIRRAIALGLGARGPEQVAVVADDQLGGDGRFAALLDGIRRHAGIAALA
jgi:uncharacterized protein (DUF362 family)